MSILMEVWGDYACFSRPEMKTERVSYDVMTPSAARGLIESIFWHPGLRWQIDRIYVRAPIRFTSVRRNEVKSTIPVRTVRTVMERGSGELYLSTRSNSTHTPRTALLLQDVRYVIKAHFDLTDQAAPGDNAGKFQEMVTRRIAKGQCYHQPYFGCREFPARFAPCTEIPPCPEELMGEKDLGWILYDMDWETYHDNPDPNREIRPRFFRAVLRDGVLRVPDVHSEEVRG